MTRTVFLLLSLFVTAKAGAQCASESNIYTFTYNGKNYEVVKENKTWTLAAACAVERGGYLAEINDAAENSAIYSELSSNAGITASNTVAPDGGGASYLWIGGNDLASEGVWIWDGANTGSGPQFWQGTSSGNPVGGLYNNWGNEPDNWNEQDGLGLAISDWPYGVASQWNDVDDGNTLYFVIEHDSSTYLKEGSNSIEIGPNPTNDFIRVMGPNLKNASILNGTGSLVKQCIELNDNLIDMSDLNEGIYLLRLELTDGRVMIERVIRN